MAPKASTTATEQEHFNILDTLLQIHQEVSNIFDTKITMSQEEISQKASMAFFWQSNCPVTNCAGNSNPTGPQYRGVKSGRVRAARHERYAQQLGIQSLCDTQVDSLKECTLIPSSGGGRTTVTSNPVDDLCALLGGPVSDAPSCTETRALIPPTLLRPYTILGIARPAPPIPDSNTIAQNTSFVGTRDITSRTKDKSKAPPCTAEEFDAFNREMLEALGGKAILWGSY